jgi:hypothetical protein
MPTKVANQSPSKNLCHMLNDLRLIASTSFRFGLRVLVILSHSPKVRNSQSPLISNWDTSPDAPISSGESCSCATKNLERIRLLRRAALQFRSRATEFFRHGRNRVLKKKTVPHSPFGVHHSPIASRHSLPFRLGESIALPFCPPTEVGDYCDEAC